MERNLLRTLGDNTLDLIYAKDRQGRYTFVNAALARMSGASRSEEMLGTTDFDWHPTELARGYSEDDQKVMHSGQPLADREELVIDSGSGESRWHSTTKVPLRDGQGHTIGIVGITRDITASKQIELSARRINAELEHRVAERTSELQALTDTLSSERQLMRALVDALPDNIFAKDNQSRFLVANQAVAKGMGSTPEGLLGKTDFEFYSEEMAQAFFEDEQELFRTGEPMLRHEEPYLDYGLGKIRWLLTSKIPLLDSNGKIVGLVGIGQDITERREAELALRESEERFRSLTELSSDWYWEQDETLRFTGLSDNNAKSGYSSSTVLGKTLEELPNTEILSGDWPDYQAIFANRRPFRDLELRHLDREGAAHYLSLNGLPIFSEDGQFHGYRGVGRDITERKVTEERVQFLATHDSLTQLPNRFMFNELVNLAIESARRYKRKLAILFIDLDRFKNINDTLGHEAGDLLLQEMASRMSECLRSSDVVARLGGDEFVILVQDVDEPERVSSLARKILAVAVKPIVVLGQECRVTTSVGISMYPDDAQDEQSLMKNADIAMYRAKEEGKNNFQFFSSEIKQRSLQKLVLENDLRLALEHDEFFLHYQAKRDLKTGSIVGVEALVRWQHPDLGVVPPAQFIPLAEETGLIVLIGRWVLKTACAENVAWQKQGLPPLCMAVNLSIRQFFDEHLVEDVAQALRESGMKAEQLEMEITEGMVMQDAERAIRILTEIKSLGVRLAIDDFGVGYSSLAQIKRFPIDTLKVDGSFIRDIPGNHEDKAITEAIIAMGRTLSLTVVAEGVETEEQETFLRNHACDQSQGFYFSRPITSAQFVEFMTQHIASSTTYPTAASSHEGPIGKKS